MRLRSERHRLGTASGCRPPQDGADICAWNTPAFQRDWTGPGHTGAEGLPGSPPRRTSRDPFPDRRPARPPDGSAGGPIPRLCRDDAGAIPRTAPSPDPRPAQASCSGRSRHRSGWDGARRTGPGTYHVMKLFAEQRPPATVYAEAMARSQISRTLREEAAVSRVAAILSRERFDRRSALGRRVCGEFSFVDARGRPQLSGCLKALAALAEREPGIALPPPKAPAVTGGPRLPGAGVPEPEGVPPHPSRIGGLRVGPVTAQGDRALWNTLMAREHPHGMAVFAGHQLRHLVGSDHGWLGAAGFPAAALRVAARDRTVARRRAGRGLRPDPATRVARRCRGPSRRTRRPSCRTCRARRRTIRSPPSASGRRRPFRRRRPPTFRRPARRFRPSSTA